MLLLPSIYEMSPLVILEAYTKKIPVLGSSHPAIAEMIEDGKTGLIFDNNNENDLFDKLNYIVNNPQIISEMKKNIPPVNSFDNVAQEHIALYKKLLDNNKI
jgi:glycosyltransferase involved in cell wall biosynthesis